MFTLTPHEDWKDSIGRYYKAYRNMHTVANHSTILNVVYTTQQAVLEGKGSYHIYAPSKAFPLHAIAYFIDMGLAISNIGDSSCELQTASCSIKILWEGYSDVGWDVEVTLSNGVPIEIVCTPSAKVTRSTPLYKGTENLSGLLSFHTKANNEK